jgi:predicted PurR-regulated permease PerM
MIAVVTFVAAYVSFVGAWVAGAFAVLIALGSQGTTDALILGVVALLAKGVLQQLIQPFVMGATLGPTRSWCSSSPSAPAPCSGSSGSRWPRR